MQNIKPLGQTLPAFLEKSNWIRKREKHAGDELCQAQAQLETHIKEQRTNFTPPQKNNPDHQSKYQKK